MKKLKTWQFVLLIIFYPVGIFYFIYWLINKNKKRVVIREISSNIIGCNYLNGDGTSRQKYLLGCKVGDDLFFKPAPTEEYPDSIGVFTAKQKQIGVVAYPALNEMRNSYPTNAASVSVERVGHDERGYYCSMLIKIYQK